MPQPNHPPRSTAGACTCYPGVARSACPPLGEGGLEHLIHAPCLHGPSTALAPGESLVQRQLVSLQKILCSPSQPANTPGSEQRPVIGGWVGNLCGFLEPQERKWRVPQRPGSRSARNGESEGGLGTPASTRSGHLLALGQPMSAAQAGVPLAPRA